MLRWYSRIVGVVLALLGLAGLLGMEGFDLGDKLLFLATAPIFWYASLQSLGPAQIRSIVGGMGVLYGSLGAFVLVVSFYLGGYVGTRELVGDFVHVAVGVLRVCGRCSCPAKMKNLRLHCKWCSKKMLPVLSAWPSFIQMPSCCLEDGSRGAQW